MIPGEIIYLDHGAATPLDPRVLQAMEPYFTDQFYNPSSPYRQAAAVRKDYDAAKQSIAGIIGAKADELVMTAGATESINLAFTGAKGHVVTSAIEHQAVLEAASHRDEHTLVACDVHGRVDTVALKQAVQPNTGLISIGLANNELGTIQPVKEAAAIVRAERERRLASGDASPLYLHIDASQGMGLLDVHTARLGCDLLTLSAAKIYGPKQVGLLWAGRQVRLAPLIVGGGQERGLRSGTENVAGVIGFTKAMELVEGRRKSEGERLRKLRDTLQRELTTRFPWAVVSGHPKHRLPGHLHISFPKLDAERLLFALENRGVLVATGSACAANKGTRSHVLTAIGLAPEVADGSLRLTLGKLSTEENTAAAAQIIGEEVTRECQRRGL